MSEQGGNVRSAHGAKATTQFALYSFPDFQQQIQNIKHICYVTYYCSVNLDFGAIDAEIVGANRYFMQERLAWTDPYLVGPQGKFQKSFVNT